MSKKIDSIKPATSHSAIWPIKPCFSSTDSITLETWHRVKIRRSGRDGIVQLDNSTVARGSAPGLLAELNLEQPLYLGFVPYVAFLLLYI